MKQQRVRRIALSYLAVIMTLSLAFSVIIYAITNGYQLSVKSKLGQGSTFSLHF